MAPTTTYRERPSFTSEDLTADGLAAAIAADHALIGYAVASVENTYELVEGSGSAVAVVNRDGTILFSRSDPGLCDIEGRSIFEPGTCWRESCRGTNAISCALSQREGVCIRGEDHQTSDYHEYCTYAAPIFGAQGEVVGLLAVLTKCGAAQLHTLGFIKTIAILVENRMLAGEMPDRLTLFFHTNPSNVGTIKQCIAAFDAQGILVGTNSTARSFFKIVSPHTQLTFGMLFSLPFQDLKKMWTQERTESFSLSLWDGRSVNVALNRRVCTAHGPGVKDKNASEHEGNPVRAPGRAKKLEFSELLLEDLDIGDAQVHRAIEKASRIIGLDLPLMVEGESGVGKEMFTRAFHNSGPRRAGPFVAVNCAAIPEQLIESELFGYEEGAFTGARRRGQQGRIAQANGGTLFLDEIGDMPLPLQGRLLRVLQDRQVFPLGSGRAVPVNLSIICATHRDLKHEIREHRFREDLYYRLNGLRIVLPALRMRTDLFELVQLLAAAEGNGREVTVSDDVMEIFRKATWPGNIRQLQMTLRTAIALAAGADVVRKEHLPDEFLSETLTGAHKIDVVMPAAESSPMMSDGSLAKVQSLAIRRAVEQANGNISEAARILGVNRKTIYRRMAIPKDE